MIGTINFILIVLMMSVLGVTFSYAQTSELSAEDDSVDFCLNESFFLSSMGNYDDVVEKLNECLEKDPNNTQVLLERGIAFFVLNRYEEALYDYDRVLEIEPNNWPALQGKAWLFFQQDKHRIPVRPEWRLSRHTPSSLP